MDAGSTSRARADGGEDAVPPQEVEDSLIAPTRNACSIDEVQTRKDGTEKDELDGASCMPGVRRFDYPGLHPLI